MIMERLEENRSLFENDKHVARGTLIRRFKSRCQLLKGNLQYSSTSTKGRKTNLKENLERIAAISSSLLFLCCTLSDEFLVSKGSTQFAVKLKQWWQSVSYPGNLKVLIQQLCDEEKIQYIETGQCYIYSSNNTINVLNPAQFTYSLRAPRKSLRIPQKCLITLYASFAIMSH
jgi:hypothetical protein